MIPSILRYTILGSLPAVIISLATVSCVNDMETVNSLVVTDTMPLETARNIEVLYSEKGKVQAMLISPLMERYGGNQPFIEFPQGITVEFYDSLMNVKSSLTANYAISNEFTSVMEARNDVEVINFGKQEQINTEHLIWNQKSRRIYSDVFVKITTPDRVLYGEEGFESDERMENWIIRKPKGSFELEDDER